MTACDVATYAAVLSDCYVATDGDHVNRDELEDVLAHLNALPGRRGYFTRTFCEEARFFQPKNGARVDAVRDAVESGFRGTPLFPVLMTALLEAADRVDSTAGMQMAYLKSWSARSANDLVLRAPALLPGGGCTVLATSSTRSVICRRATSCTWIRPTTSIGTSRTTTSGRRWSAGTPRRTTASLQASRCARPGHQVRVQQEA